VLFDPGVELRGDVAGPLLGALADPGVAVAGAFGVRAVGRIGHFHPEPGADVDALEGYVLAFRRQDAKIGIRHRRVCAVASPGVCRRPRLAGSPER